MLQFLINALQRDRAADRQPHPHAVLLRGEKRVEQLILDAAADAMATEN
jgi:hypothetical protein